MSEKQYGEQFPSPLVPPGNRTGDPNTRITPVIDPDEIAARDPRRGSVVGDYLNRILSQQEPELARFLVRRMGENSQEPTFNEIARAVANGEVEPRWLEKWRLNYVDAYSGYIRERMARAGRSAAGSIISSTQFRNPDLVESLFNRELDRWLDLRGADLVQDISRAERDGLRQFLRHFTFDRPANPRAIARYLRPVIGLTVNEAARVQNIIDKAREDGASDMEAMAIGERASLRSRRFRAERIARTELAFAFNYASLATMQMANEANEFPGTRIVKRWYTQLDERVCPWCGPLHDQIVEMEQTFPGATRRVPNVYAPPAHPMCRCVLMYDYIDDDSLEFDPDDESLQAEADAILAGEQDSESTETGLAQPETAPAAPPDLAPTPEPGPQRFEPFSMVGRRSLRTPFESEGGDRESSPDEAGARYSRIGTIYPPPPGDEDRDFTVGAPLSDEFNGIVPIRIGIMANESYDNSYTGRDGITQTAFLPYERDVITRAHIDRFRDRLAKDIDDLTVTQSNGESLVLIYQSATQPINREVRERVELAFSQMDVDTESEINKEALRDLMTAEFNGLYAAKPEGFLEGDHPSDRRLKITNSSNTSYLGAYSRGIGDAEQEPLIKMTRPSYFGPDDEIGDDEFEIRDRIMRRTLTHEYTHRIQDFNGQWRRLHDAYVNDHFKSDMSSIGLVRARKIPVNPHAVFPSGYSVSGTKTNGLITRDKARIVLGFDEREKQDFGVNESWAGPGSELWTEMSAAFSDATRAPTKAQRDEATKLIGDIWDTNPDLMSMYMAGLRGDAGWSPGNYQLSFWPNKALNERVHNAAIREDTRDRLARQRREAVYDANGAMPADPYLFVDYPDEFPDDVRENVERLQGEAEQ